MVPCLTMKTENGDFIIENKSIPSYHSTRMDGW